jgi:PQQ-dependent dehydrogenase (methanol/ethanol family)
MISMSGRCLAVAMLAVLGLATGLAARAAPPADDGQWTMAAKDYASTRYSALDQITPGNARHLKVAFTFSVGVEAGQEAAPLVVNNTMYVVAPYPNYLYALDLTKPGAPMKWKFEPEPDAWAQGVACCDVVNRGVAYADGRIFMNTLDGQTIAVDADSGKEIWRTRLGNIKKGETVTMAPLVVKDKVLVGNSGGEMGVRGWLVALDAKSGKEAWRAWSTGPDKDVLIGPEFKPWYESDRGKDLGVKTWPPEAWKIGGGNAWGWLSYDPEADLVYYGTGNPGPWNPEQRPGDNKWTASVIARRPADGSIAWAYQFTPHDSWDFDATAELVLVDLVIHGKPRKTLVQFNKNGFAYTLDRATGEVLVAEPFVETNWAKKIDLATGRPVLDSTKLTGASRGNVKHICPTLEGGKTPAAPVAYSPATKLFYVSTNNMCMDYAATPVTHIPGTPFIGANSPYYAGAGGNMGAFIAWDAATGKKVWEIKEHYPVWSGVVATGGGVVFYGTLDGWFKAVDAHDGRLLWKFKVGSGIVGNPITYLGPDGRQYVAVYAGIGGDWFLLSGDVRSDDPADVRDAAPFVKDLARRTSQGGIVYLFALQP